MGAQDVHTTHIETNIDNIKNNALLYIEHSYNKTYNYYKSIAETILNLLFGAPYSIGMVDWGKPLGNSSLKSPSGTHPGFLLVTTTSVSSPCSASIP
jgi:hypothetical protein